MPNSHVSPRLLASFSAAENLSIDRLRASHEISQLTDEEVAAVLAVGDDRDNCGQAIKQILAQAETRRRAAASEEARKPAVAAVYQNTPPAAD